MLTQILKVVGALILLLAAAAGGYIFGLGSNDTAAFIDPLVALDSSTVHSDAMQLTLSRFDLSPKNWPLNKNGNHPFPYPVDPLLSDLLAHGYVPDENRGGSPSRCVAGHAATAYLQKKTLLFGALVSIAYDTECNVTAVVFGRLMDGL